MEEATSSLSSAKVPWGFQGGWRASKRTESIGGLGKRMMSAWGSLGRWKEAPSHDPPRALFSLILSLFLSRSLCGRESNWLLPRHPEELQSRINNIEQGRTLVIHIIGNQNEKITISYKLKLADLFTFQKNFCTYLYLNIFATPTPC